MNITTTDTLFGIILILAVLLVGACLGWRADNRLMQHWHKLSQQYLQGLINATSDEAIGEAYQALVRREADKYFTNTLLGDDTDAVFQAIGDAIANGQMSGTLTVNDDGTIVVDADPMPNLQMTEVWPPAKPEPTPVYDETATVHGEPLLKPVVSVFEPKHQPAYYGD